MVLGLKGRHWWTTAGESCGRVKQKSWFLEEKMRLSQPQIPHFQLSLELAQLHQKNFQFHCWKLTIAGWNIHDVDGIYQEKWWFSWANCYLIPECFNLKINWDKRNQGITHVVITLIFLIFLLRCVFSGFQGPLHQVIQCDLLIP